MKKKNFKALKLNKNSISHFKPINVRLVGGVFLTENDVRVCNLSIIDGSICLSQGGCTGGDDETITCAAASCKCYAIR